MHVQMPSASCTCTVVSLSVIKSVSDEINAVPLLWRSVQRAQSAIAAGPPDEARINAVVATLAAELAPAFPHLQEMADSRPNGAVAAVLTQLRTAFAHAAARRPDRVVTAVVTASTTAYRLADAAALDALDAATIDRARWR